MKTSLIKYAISITLLVLGLDALAKSPAVSRSAQYSTKTLAGKEFYNTCFTLMKKNQPADAGSVCSCIARNLENNLGPHLGEKDIRTLAKSYCQENCGEQEDSDSLDLEMLYKFESTTAVQCLKNSDANISIKN